MPLFTPKECDLFASAPQVWIDVRSEGEFAQGHIPGAINCPVLNNEERIIVGTTYKQVSTTEAVQVGLELFAKKADAFLSQIEAAAGDTQNIHLYCWRGGMRSQMVAKWLSCGGFSGHWLAGGYKAYRKEVLAALERLGKHPLLVAHGHTGVGKSVWLGELEAKGFPVLDFQRMACHRGSIFGAMGQSAPCPTQQNFENQLAHTYVPLAKAPRLLVEIEGFIGPLALPKTLRESIQKSPMLLLSRNKSERVSHLQSLYVPDLDRFDEATCLENFAVLHKLFSREEREEMEGYIRARNFPPVISCLLDKRYDPAYTKSLVRSRDQVVKEFDMSVEKREAEAFVRSFLSE